ncbi:MAG: FAD-dependent oxidoreductase [Thermoleophilia bacterium]
MSGRRSSLFSLHGNNPGRRRRIILARVLLVLLVAGVGLWFWQHEAPSTQGLAPAPPPADSVLPSTDPVLLPPTDPIRPRSTLASVDVVVYGTQTSGIAAVREITEGNPRLRVAVVSSGRFLESPLVQGLSVEDVRNASVVVGRVYREWRDAVIGYYRAHNKSPFTSSGRFVYGPQVAARFLWPLLEGSETNEVLFISGQLVAADDTGDSRYLTLRRADGSLASIDTRYFIDASVEADLARMLGADYRVGRGEAVFNDVSGPTPPFPSQSNDFITAPQRISALLTLKLYGNNSAPRITQLTSPLYNPATYDSAPKLKPAVRDAFARGWSMAINRLPDQERELNETWSDYPDVAASFNWVFDPAKRPEIRRRVVERTLNLVRDLQEHGYPHVGIANIPQYPYVREGPRVVGLTTYTSSQLVSGHSHEVVAIGCYTQYDRHDIVHPTMIDKTAYALVPMGALMVKGHPWLLVSTAVSTDYRAYSSPVRMEHTRANMGGAAGAMVVLAARLGTEVTRVPYEQVGELLRQRGYNLSMGPAAEGLPGVSSD